MKIKLTEEQTSLLNKFGATVVTPQGDVYMYLPYWYKKTDVDNVFEDFSFDNLPNYLKESLNERINLDHDIPSFDLTKTYLVDDNVKYGGSIWVFSPKVSSRPSSFNGIEYVVVSVGIYPGTGNGWKVKKS